MAREHGTVSRYQAGCRCPECVAAKRAYNREYRRRRILRRPTTNLVDAAPVRAHAQQLLAQGYTAPLLARATGVGIGIINRLLYPPRKGGQPSRRVNSIAARRILAVPVPEVPVESWARVCADGPRRRAQALAAIGWPLAWQARQIGMLPADYHHFVAGSGISARYAARVRVLYEQYWDVDAPPSLRGTSRVREAARRNGWLPPMAWDDDLIDLPESELRAALEARVARMDWDELVSCRRAYRAGDRSPLIVAARREYARRRPNREPREVAA